MLFSEKIFFLKRLTKPKLQIFFDYNDNKSCKGGPKQNFGQSWHYWVNSVALSKEKKKGCFYTVLGTCQKTFVTGCRYLIHGEIVINHYKFIIVKSFTNYVREIFYYNWEFTQMCRILVLLEGFEQSSRLKNEKNYSHRKKFRQINYFCIGNFFSKNVSSLDFLPK